jgi:hypothetical protein
MKMATAKSLWRELVTSYGISVPQEEEGIAMEYIVSHYGSLLGDKDAASNLGLTPKQYALETIMNGINDGEHMDGIEVTDLGNGMQMQTVRDQEIIEVNQDEVKEALKTLSTQGAGKGDKMADSLQALYDAHAEFNSQHFHGLLSRPLITIAKLDNRTLGVYTPGQDAMGIRNHIELNLNFVALNPTERVFEDLLHQMIHQWQDEVLYMEGKKAGTFPRIILDEDGKRQTITETQKKRPKDWHNRDFKQMASAIGIPAEGDKCYGSPVKMPEPKSYNRKFVCGCVASNGHPLTVWSTRTITAFCRTCEQDYIEVKKGGKVIQVAQSHVEQPGEDAVLGAHKDNYTYFERFQSKEAKDDFVKTFEEAGRKLDDMAEGVYQKGHNAYKEGFTHWVAFNAEKASKQAKPPRQLKKAAPKKAAAPKKPEAPKKKRSHTNPDDLTELYVQFGTIKAIADYFGVQSGTIIYQAKRLNVDFKQIKGEMRNE